MLCLNKCIVFIIIFFISSIFIPDVLILFEILLLDNGKGGVNER